MYYPFLLNFFRLALACSILVSGWAAETLEEPSSPQPEIERPTIVKPQKKKSRSRSTAAHRSRNDRVEIGKDVVISAGETVHDLVVVAGNATVDGTVEGDLVVISGTAQVNGRVSASTLASRSPCTRMILGWVPASAKAATR